LSIAVPLFSRPIKLGVVASEFFDPALGQTGGFGWAAKRLATLFGIRPDLGVEVVFLSAQHWSRAGESTLQTEGTRVLVQQGLKYRHRALRAAWREKIDVLLTIDYRWTYDAWLWALPRTPVIVWSRDPRTPQDVAHVQTLRIPGRPDVVPAGIAPQDCTPLGKVVRRSRLLGRRIVIASKMPHIAAKSLETYGVEPSEFVLPNPDLFDYGSVPIVKSARPRVLFLGRLDPIKRPWLFIELARAFPDVEFMILGRAHFDGAGGWTPDSVPENLRLIGQVTGRAKLEMLAAAWALVSTSIHEDSPVSCLEALACETPVLGCTDWGDVVQRFGIFVGRYDGDGMAGLPALAEGLDRLLGDRALRERLGRAGRAWVEQEHNTGRFLAEFSRICHQLRVGRP
jgi:glycosyltransferase involved in cell wall biosynthesis